MNELMKVKTNDGKELRITSAELVDIINQFREIEAGTLGNKTNVLAHKNFMAKIRNEVEVLKSLGLDGQLNFKPSSYVNSQNKKQPCYSLNRDGMLQMLNSESALVRYKTIEYINELEKKLGQPKLPTTYKEALLALVEAEEEKERLMLENKTMLPKAEFYDDVAGSKDAISIGEVAKILGIRKLGRNNLFQLLRDKKILQPNNQPYQKFVDIGYFRIIEQRYTTQNGDTKINIKTLVYQKGLDFIRRIIKENL